MPQFHTTSEIQSRVEQFVDELSDLIREAAFEAVRTALGNGASPKPARSAKKASRKKAGRRASSGTDVSDAVLAHVRSNPGSRAEEIATALGADGGDVKKALARLKGLGSIKAQGVARGTNYAPAGRGGAKKASRKKGARRKRAARKTAATSAK